MTDRSIRIPSPHQKVPIQQKPWVFLPTKQEGSTNKDCLFVPKAVHAATKLKVSKQHGVASPALHPYAARRRGCVGPEQLHVSGLALSYPGLREPPGGDPICQRGATLLPEAEPAGAHHPSPGETDMWPF